MPLTTFGKCCLLTYVRPDLVPMDDPQDVRDEIGWYLWESLYTRWYDLFRSMHGLTATDVIPGRSGGMTVKKWIDDLVMAERNKIDQLGVDEWWAYEFEALILADDEAERLLAMEQPPRPASWTDPWGGELRCEQCGARHSLGNHHSGQMLCQNCVDTHYNGFW